MKKWWIVASIPIVLPIVAVPTSCSPNSREYYQYIFDHTFSIGKFDSSGYGVIGTGWLFYHISNYEYYMFTNLHVELGQNTISGDRFAFSYTDICSNDSRIRNYIDFSNFDYIWSAIYSPDDSIKHWGIDACVAKIDFGNDLSDYLKNKLNNLNKKGDNCSLLNFSHQRMHSGQIWMGGYPAANWSATKYNFPQWESGTDNLDRSLSFFNKNNPSEELNVNHPIDSDDYDDSQYISMSDAYKMPNYKFKNSSPFYKMGGGASGSMAINRNKEVAGLYWGGYEYTNNTYAPWIESAYKNNNYDLYEDFLQSQSIS